MSAEKILNITVRGVAATIGLASEGIKAHKAKKNPIQTLTPKENSDSGIIIYEDPPPYSLEEPKDEEEWSLDEAQEKCLPPTSSQKERISQILTSGSISQDDELLIEQFVLDSFRYLKDNPPLHHHPKRLPYPVILPQRRPKTRTRGFVKAYAPALADVGINQEQFLDFIETFNTVTEASPWIDAINLAGFGSLFVSHPVAVMMAIAIECIVRTTKEVQGRKRTNTFLDQINTSFFQPKGLYCLIMTWNPSLPNEKSTTTPFNLPQTITSNLSSPSPKTTTIEKLNKKFKLSSGDTTTMTFPETAPLIFPNLNSDNKLQNPTNEEDKKGNLLTGVRNFTRDYMDRRARASHRHDYPSSFLAVGPPDIFNSKYADPSHPVNSGSFIDLISGGSIKPPPSPPKSKQSSGERLGVEEKKEGFATVVEIDDDDDDDVVTGTGTTAQVRNGNGDGNGNGRRVDGLRRERVGAIGTGDGFLDAKLGSVTRVLGRNVLYLMVVNMPTDAEMAAASRALGRIV